MGTWHPLSGASRSLIQWFRLKWVPSGGGGRAKTVFGVFSMTWLFAFRRVRTRLLPFLVSRSVLVGCGMLDRHGRFHLADKAPAINCVVGYGGFLADRPIFTMGHIFKTLCVEACFSLRDYAELFSPKHLPGWNSIAASWKVCRWPLRADRWYIEFDDCSWLRPRIARRGGPDW